MSDSVIDRRYWFNRLPPQLVAALSRLRMKIGRMRFARIERDDHALVLQIDSYVRQLRHGRLLRVTDEMLRSSRMRRRKSAIQRTMASQKKRDGFSPSRSRSNKLSALLRYAVENA